MRFWKKMGEECPKIVFALIFLIWLGLFLFIAIGDIRQWHKNNNSPRWTVDAAAAKRFRTSRHHDANTHTGRVSKRAIM